MALSLGRVLSASLLFGLLLGLQPGCIALSPTIEFTLTDRANSPKYRSHALVYIDRLPADDYFSIGILVVKAAGDFPLSQVIEELEEQGSRHGCDVVVAREIHRISSTVPAGGHLLASLDLRGLGTRVAPPKAPRTSHLAYHSVELQSPPPVYQPTPVNVVNVRTRAPDREFICGVID
jgi:hypothetical protein